VDALSSAWRFDPHPPLYYLQLHGWFEVVGVSEMGARANSWLISVLCSVALYAAAARHLGERIGFLATVLFAVAPYSVFQGGLVRMYALLMLLAVLLWATTTAVLESVRWRVPAIGMLAVTLAALATHGAAVLLWASSLVLIVMWFVNDPTTRWRRAALAASLQLACLTPVIPWFAFHRRMLAHPLKPLPGDVARTAFELLVAAAHPAAWAAATATAIMAVLMVIGFRDDQTRSMAAAFLLAPLVLAAVLSYAVQPIWLTRTFAAFVPFWCIAGAVAIYRAKPYAPRGTALASGVGILLCLMFVLGVWRHPEDEARLAYRTAAHLITDRAGPTDRVLLDSPRAYWAYAWYALHQRPVDTSDPDAYTASLPDGPRVLLADRYGLDLPAAPGGTTWWLIESVGAGRQVDLLEILGSQFPECSKTPNERVPVYGLLIIRVRC